MEPVDLTKGTVMDTTCGFFTLVHHRGPLIEWSYDITDRHRYIDAEKFKHERAIRHRCIVRVPEDRLPRLYAAREDYERIEGPARVDYERIQGPALAEYQRIKGIAWEEYQRIEGPALAEYQRIKGIAWEEYQRIKRTAWEDYERIQGPPLAEYQRIKGIAWEDYERIEGTILADPTTLALVQDLVPDCPWDARKRTIFPEKVGQHDR